MSAVDLAKDLERSFRTTAALLRQLLETMQRRRMHWASARPSTLQPSAELERLAGELQDTERARGEVLAAIAQVLPLPPGLTADEVHLDVTRIAAALPAVVGRALRAAADEATKLARTVRAEVALGERLLRFTQRAQESVFGQLAGPAPDAASGYDRNARLRAGLALAAGTGRLLDGKI